MSVEELFSLPVMVDLATANRALGIGRTVGYRLARQGQYPVPLIRVGSRYRITRASLLHYLTT